MGEQIGTQEFGLIYKDTSRMSIDEILIEAHESFSISPYLALHYANLAYLQADTANAPGNALTAHAAHLGSIVLQHTQLTEQAAAWGARVKKHGVVYVDIGYVNGTEAFKEQLAHTRNLVSSLRSGTPPSSEEMVRLHAIAERLENAPPLSSTEEGQESIRNILRPERDDPAA